MPNLFSNLIECLGFSQMIRSTSFIIKIALLLKSFKFPIGVAIIYKPFFKILSLNFFVFIIFSCTPQIFLEEEISSEQTNLETSKKDFKKEDDLKLQKKDFKFEQKDEFKLQEKEFEIKKIPIISEVEVILPKSENELITKNFVNALELSLYKKDAKEISFNINLYSNNQHLQKILKAKAAPGKIFIGPLTSKDTKNINYWCKKGVLFFSFASNRDLAKDCVYLINFFPEDDLYTLFDHFKNNKKIALLYPENKYGYYISNIIDDISTQSSSILVNKASYKEDLSNAREAIKELSKYELRKYELERQKKILKNKKDKESIKALKKIEKFETIGDVNFTHLIIPDYNVRLLQIAPLLPFYDIDPNKIQFVGTGVWDDEVFFYEPSLQGAIFPGISKDQRSGFMNEYFVTYGEQPIRTITIIYDLVGLISYILEKELNISLTFDLLNNSKINFDGIDGKFMFENNLIKRKLKILKISNGKANLIN